MSLNDVLDLTISQMEFLEHYLHIIIKRENGGDNDRGNDVNVNETSAQTNTNVHAATLRMLAEQTGRTKFTMSELLDPMGTLKKLKEGTRLPPKKE